MWRQTTLGFQSQLSARKLCPSQDLMSTIHYFAYGSKRSKDGSAKCNAFRTAEPTDAVIGVVYEIPTNEKPALDRAEGLVPGINGPRNVV